MKMKYNELQYRHYRIRVEARTPAFKNTNHIEIRMSYGNLSASLHNFLGRIEPTKYYFFQNNGDTWTKWNKTYSHARTHAFVE